MLRVHDGVTRPNWEGLIKEQGLTYWRTEMPDSTIKSYWREGPHYTFTSAEIEEMYADAETIFQMLIDAGEYIIERPDLMRRMGIPDFAHEQVITSWNRHVKIEGEEHDFGSVYGRYDVAFGGHTGDPRTRRLRLLEFNADTPTSLVESAICQWSYHKQTGQGEDQWNGIYESLVDAWKRNLAHIEALLGHKPIVHFVCSGEDVSGEDVKNLQCLQSACEKAGYETKALYIEQLYYNELDGRFYDSEHGGLHLDVVFKLYPWEMMVREKWGEVAFRDMSRVGERSPDDNTYIGGTVWIEPPYKMLWSNKAILAVLWQLFGDDPEKSQLLLPAYFADEKPDWMTSYVKKPIFSREGASLEIVIDDQIVEETEGIYGSEGFVAQQYVPLPNFPSPNPDGSTQDNHPVLGIWMIDGEPQGLCIRESEGRVTDNLSCFAPHVIAA